MPYRELRSRRLMVFGVPGRGGGGGRWAGMAGGMAALQVSTACSISELHEFLAGMLPPSRFRLFLGGIVHHLMRREPSADEDRAREGRLRS